MHTKFQRFLMLCSVALVGGCATMTSGGFTVYTDLTEQAFQSIRARASYEWTCPQGNLELVVLDAVRGLLTGAGHPTVIGVSGCGQRATYIYSGGQWIANKGGR